MTDLRQQASDSFVEDVKALSAILVAADTPEVFTAAVAELLELVTDCGVTAHSGLNTILATQVAAGRTFRLAIEPAYRGPAA